MAIRTISVLKSYFNTGDKPTESQFADLIDSFFHKSLSIPISSIENLTEFLDNKVDKIDGKGLSTHDLTTQLLSEINDISNKVDKVDGMTLTSNDFTDALLVKLQGLENTTFPDSQPISYIEQLQEQLDLKLNIEDAVISVNGTAADANGNIQIDVTNTDRLYDLTEEVSIHNYTYFGATVFVVVIPLTNAVSDGDNALFFPNPTNVITYIKTELRSKYGTTGDPIMVLDADPTGLTIEDNGFEEGSYLYLEFTQQIEGISVDGIGEASIGGNGESGTGITITQ